MSDVPLGVRATAARKRARSDNASATKKRSRTTATLPDTLPVVDAGADPRLVKFAKLFAESKKRAATKGRRAKGASSKGPAVVPIAKKKVGLQARLLGSVGGVTTASSRAKRDPRFDPLCGTLPPQSAPELIAARFPFIAEAEEREEKEITAKLRRHRLALQEEAAKGADGDEGDDGDDSDESAPDAEERQRAVLTEEELAELTRRRQSLRSRLFSRADAEKKRAALRKIRDEEAAAVAKGKTPYFHRKGELRRLASTGAVDHDAKREARKGRRDGNVARRQLREMQTARERKQA